MRYNRATTSARFLPYGTVNVHRLGSGREHRRGLDLGDPQPEKGQEMTIVLGFIIAAVFFTGGFITGRNWPKK